MSDTLITRASRRAGREADRLGLANAQGLPDTIRAAFAPAHNLPEAEAYTRKLTHGHYENFSVVSALLPRHLRQDFCNVYAFCRIADDLGDEVGDKKKSLDYLAAFRRQLLACRDIARSPGAMPEQAAEETLVFRALRQTIRRHDIPSKPFEDLIAAFVQDQVVSRYQTFAQLVDYCTKSADPVGRIVLYMCGHRDEPRQRLSDRICTALQLINFWQDVRRDVLERDRIYIPDEDLQRFGVTEGQLREGRVNAEYRALLRFEVERTEALFDEGEALLLLLEPEYRRQIGLFAKGGRAICAAVRRRKFDTLTRRPRLSKWQKGRLIAGTCAGLMFNSLAGKRSVAPEERPVAQQSLAGKRRAERGEP